MKNDISSTTDLTFRFTEEVHNLLVKNMPDQPDWTASSHPYQLRRSLMGWADFAENGNTSRKKMASVTVDEEYLKWTEELHLPVSMITVKRYADTLNKDDLLRLMRKNHYDRTYFVNAIALIFHTFNGVRGSASLRLSEQTNQLLKQYFETWFDSESIYIPGYVLKPEIFAHCEDEFTRDAEKYFETGTGTFLKKYSRQKFPKSTVNAGVLYIPVTILHKADKADFTLRELTNEKNPMNVLWHYPLAADFQKEAGVRRKEFHDSSAYYSLRLDLGQFDILVPSPEMVNIEVVPQATDVMREMIRNSMAAAGFQYGIRSV